MASNGSSRYGRARVMVAPEEGSPCETALARIGEKTQVGFPPRLCDRPRDRAAYHGESVDPENRSRNLARGTDGDNLGRAGGRAGTRAGRRGRRSPAGPGDGRTGRGRGPAAADCLDLRAAIDDALAGRARPEVPIDVTLEAGGVVVRVGSLWRRSRSPSGCAALRTVALHVLNLSQPAPEMPDVAPAGPTAGPPAMVVAEASADARATEQTTDSGGPWSVRPRHRGGARRADAQSLDGLDDRRRRLDSPRLAANGVEIGWDHSIVRHVDSAGVLTTVNYDCAPLRLVLAVQNSTMMAGVRGGVAEYRVTGQQHYWMTTPLVGPFVAARTPIVGRFRGMLVGSFDYFARRTELTNGFDTLYSTPAVAPYIGVVLEAGLTL